ncbi:aldo/keto reductase [Nonomuraea sp. NPDC005983]|uniref:aldo/keto reductase n=1 Tax=Nonomuraea sp. NPDC005983 TaxID=3155595 RepID=UPI0033A7FE3C
MVPMITLNDQSTLPQLGFGTALIPLDQTADVVGQALQAGYRHIDTGQLYGNEQGVGTAIAASGIPREELYVTSKLSTGDHRPDDVRRSFDKTLERLGLDRLDFFLIHWPLPTRYDGDYVSTWKAVTDLVADGRLRTAGVSNFEPAHLDRVIADTGLVPAVNQIEAHPYFANDTVREASRRHGIAVEAWGPLGQGAVLGNELLGKIAAAHGKTISQVTLRWHIQRGDVVFPKTTSRKRMEENLDLFGFSLSAEEVEAINSLDQGEAGRRGPHPDTFDYVP